MKTQYNPKTLFLLSVTVAGSLGWSWKLVAKTMCLTQSPPPVIAAQLSVSTHCRLAQEFFSTSRLLLQPDRSPRRLAEQSCHLALPVITDRVHTVQSVSTTLTSAVSPPSHQLRRDVISESAFHAASGTQFSLQPVSSGCRPHSLPPIAERHHTLGSGCHAGSSVRWKH